MKKIVVFDLRGTLVTKGGEWVDGAQEAIKLVGDWQTEAILYSMNEAWTYQTLSRYADVFEDFNEILLVDKKRPSDLFTLGTNDVLVVGDSDTEELAFGKRLGYRTVKITGEVLLDEIKQFLGEKR